MNRQVNHRQMLLWCAVAQSAPLAIYAGKASWIWVLIVGVLGTIAVTISLKFGDASYGVLLRIGQTVILAAVAGTFAGEISACWGEDGFAIPLSLISLAVLSAIGGSERSARISCVIAWIVALLLIIVLLAGIKNLDFSRIRVGYRNNGMLPVVFFIPAVFLMLPHEKGKGMGLLWTIPVFAVCISVWCEATLSDRGVTMAEIPFYEYSKSLNLLGVAERFEALASVVLTLGMFCALSLFFSVSETMIKNGSILAGIGASLTCSCVKVNPTILTVLTFALWVVLPLVRKRKKSKNNEKSA